MADTLFVFDFDHSLIDDNTDTWVMDIRPELRIRENLGAMRRRFECWTDLMDHVFMIIHKAGCGQEDVLEHMGTLGLYEQSLKAIRIVAGCKNTDAIVLSDSNSVFIDCILSKSGLKEVFRKILTNPAHFDSKGRLHVQRFHSHNCDTCASSPNMCKGTILSEYLQQNGGYNRVVYIGDGRGDYCPCVQLGEKDVVVCREGYSLASKLAGGTTPVRATVHVVNFETSLSDAVSSICSRL